LEITFAGEQFKTLLAASADEALQLLRAETPNVALVDASLGAVSGYDLCQQIKAQAPTTAVLVLSSKQQPYDRGRGAAVGADDFMDKPFDTQQLIDKVKGLVKNAAAGAVATTAAAPHRQAPPPVQAPARVQPVEPPRTPALAYGTPGSAPPQKPPAAARPIPQRAPVTSPGLAPTRTTAQPAAGALVTQATEAAATNGQLAGKLGELGLSNEQVEAVMALSREVVERVVWEVVPTLAETLIKEEIQRWTSE